MDTGRDYTNWTKERLIKRIRILENDLKESANPDPTSRASTSASNGPKKKEKKKLDPSKYSTRFIALKLAYLGKNYYGFEHQPATEVPTIEGELWKALVKSCLIFPESPDEVDWVPWEYSKCGRTDKGVSAFGQVIGIRVRSNRPLEKPAAETPAEGEAPVDGEAIPPGERDETTRAPVPGTHEEKSLAGKTRRPPFDQIADEIPYCKTLNRLLPPDIKVLAWCPSPPEGFSARFSCRERQYRYYFTQPAFSPAPQAQHPKEERQEELGKNSLSARVRDSWLDITAMRKAAKMFEGLHDFRNFCKVDPSKQITNFERHIFEADVVPVPDVHSALPYLDRAEFNPQPHSGLSPRTAHPQVYSFNVRGSAFLWHQIRHMVAVLFAVGQGLEAPSVVAELLDVRRHPRRPAYAMAEEVPLVLWDCLFKGPYGDDGDDAEDGLDWVWVGEDGGQELHGAGGLVDHLWRNWRERKMDELLANRLLAWAESRGGTAPRTGSIPVKHTDKSQRVFEGGNNGMKAGTYVPIMRKPLLPLPEEVNDKWAQRKGFASAEEMKSTGNWRSAIKAARKAAVEGEGDE